MSEILGLKAKLGLDVFKHDSEPHIRIKAGMEKDPVGNQNCSYFKHSALDLSHKLFSIHPE
jgi:hypothetical protein